METAAVGMWSNKMAATWVRSSPEKLGNTGLITHMEMAVPYFKVLSETMFHPPHPPSSDIKELYSLVMF